MLSHERRGGVRAHERSPFCTDEKNEAKAPLTIPPRRILGLGLRSCVKCRRKRNVAASYTISNPVAQSGLYLFAVRCLHKYVFAGNTKLNVAAGRKILIYMAEISHRVVRNLLIGAGLDKQEKASFVGCVEQVGSVLDLR